MMSPSRILVKLEDVMSTMGVDPLKTAESDAKTRASNTLPKAPSMTQNLPMVGVQDVSKYETAAAVS
jgi:hypothetical protein